MTIEHDHVEIKILTAVFHSDLNHQLKNLMTEMEGLGLVTKLDIEYQEVVNISHTYVCTVVAYIKLKEDDPGYMAECWLGRSLGDPKCEDYWKWEQDETPRWARAYEMREREDQ